MRSQKGITLVSVAIYIVLIFIVIAILATVTTNIRSNLSDSNKEGEKIAEVNKFNMFFIQEVKNKQNSVDTIENNRIEFSNGKAFVFDSTNKCISLAENEATIVIAEDIESCTFEKKLENGKNIIEVKIKPKDSSLITKEYVLNTEEVNTIYENEEDYTYTLNNTENSENIATE